MGKAARILSVRMTWCREMQRREAVLLPWSHPAAPLTMQALAAGPGSPQRSRGAEGPPSLLCC